MKLASVLLLFAATPLFAQPTIRVREVAPANAISSETFSNIFNVREVAGGRVLVNDAVRRQLIALDANLTHAIVALDSTSDSGPNYGRIPEPLLKWLGDSSIIMDEPSRTMLVLDGSGHVVRAMAPPRQNDMFWIYSSESALDQHGNLLYRIGGYKYDSSALASGGKSQTISQSDSAAIVRANFETRTVDTIGRIKQDNSTVSKRTTLLNGKQSLHIRLNPLVTIDEWTALPDGTLAFVRGHDYHVDWLLPDGSWQHTGKLPFSWKPLSDSDKQHLIDTTRTTIERLRASAEQTGGKLAGDEAVHAFLRNAVATTSRPAATPAPSAAPAAPQPELSYDFAPLAEIADYFPPVRLGAAKADLDGNLWILPTTSAESRKGELVYDVVNPHGAPFYRVRMPAGRSIVGFGRNGALYLMSRDAQGWHLERTTVASSVTARY